MKFENLDRSDIIKILFLILTLLGIGAVAIYLAPWVLAEVKEPGALRELIQSYGAYGFIIFILLEALIVFTVVIPTIDIFLNVFAGYVFGFPLGILLSLSGITLGAVCSYNISRLLGYGLVNKFVPQKTIDKMSSILNSTSGFVSMLVIYLIPGIPKDLMMYFAGLTPVKTSRIFSVYILSWIPALLIEVSAGAQLHERDTTGMIITFLGFILFAVVILILRKKYKNKTS